MHNRIVVYEGSLDEVLGLVSLRYLVRAQRLASTGLQDLVRSVLNVPATKPADA